MVRVRASIVMSTSPMAAKMGGTMATASRGMTMSAMIPSGIAIA